MGNKIKTIIEWLVNNKEWIFGGIGIFVLSLFAKRFLSKKIIQKQSQKQTIKGEGIQKQSQKQGG